MDGIKRKSLLILSAVLVIACFNGCDGNGGNKSLGNGNVCGN